MVVTAPTGGEATLARLTVSARKARWPWASMRPGSSDRSPSSTVSLAFPDQFSARPTQTISSPRMATAVASANASSMVRMLSPTNSRSATTVCGPVSASAGGEVACRSQAASVSKATTPRCANPSVSAPVFILLIPPGDGQAVSARRRWRRLSAALQWPVVQEVVLVERVLHPQRGFKIPVREKV